MKQLYRGLVTIGNFATPAGEKLYESAKKFVGKDASPKDKAPDDLGCAESVSEILKATFGDEKIFLSTWLMYPYLRDSELFIRVNKAIRGDIILSPTGLGYSKKIGHVGIVGDNGVVMSNNSDTGKFDTKFTLKTWKEYYQDNGGFPVYYFRRVFIN